MRGFLQYIQMRYLLAGFILCLTLFIYHLTHAATIHQYSDTLSDSGPNESSNHTIRFTTRVAIPAGGFVRFTPDDGDFLIPAVDFDIDNVALYVATSSGYQLRLGTTTIFVRMVSLF